MKNMKRMLSFVIAISMLLAACSGPSSEEQDAKQLVTDYKKAMLEVKDYREIKLDDDSFYTDKENKIKAFFTEKGSKVLVNREFMLYIVNAARNKHNLEMGEVQLRSMKEESDVYDYEYLIPVRVKDEAGKLLEELEYKGQVKLTKENGRLLIDREWSRPMKPLLW
ncbi:hypothetical protein D3P09_23470 [Paenibacillus pinisoli]|uniref:DUF5105 domain-containing protein n=1 Tax=Paenibacillus pinisoli TaxID=1276110 RepID=A0A3A6PB32_9BACL|nr:hypothetical protein [Paenibacillus pinisoli]RJX37315.1 hypothetical protein D3P09_23470 [Paenibacillus pinisoli]